MINRNRRLLPHHGVALSLMAGLLVVGLLSVFSDVVLAGCGDVETSLIECPDSAEGGDIIFFVLGMAIQILTSLIGVAAVGAVVYAGVLYSSSAGQPDKLAKAKNVLVSTVIGLIAFAFMAAAAHWLIPGGVFSGQGTNTAQTGGGGGSKKPSGSGSSGGNNSNNSSSSNSSSSGGGSNSGSSGSSSGGGSNSGSSSSNSSSSTASLPTFKGIKNFRTVEAAGVIKPGILYRSARLYEATPDDVSKMSTLMAGGVIIDLRLKDKIKQYPDKNIPGATNVNYEATGTVNGKKFVTNSRDRASMNKAITMIATAPGRVLIHCTHGKDRTGWAVAMVMYLLGATDEQVKAEYLKSQKTYPQVKWSNIKQGIDLARKDYGSIENYVKKGLGVSDQTILKLKQKLKA